jgi:hypothetical protein
MSLLSDRLCAAELNAECAGIQELRMRMYEVIALRSELVGDDLDHANALLMKLSRLISEQSVHG